MPREQRASGSQHRVGDGAASGSVPQLDRQGEHPRSQRPGVEHVGRAAKGRSLALRIFWDPYRAHLGMAQAPVHGSGVFTRGHLAGISGRTAPVVAAPFGLAVAPNAALGLASAELYTTSSKLYGHFDARVQFAPGDGVFRSFFLWRG